MPSMLDLLDGKSQSKSMIDVLAKDSNLPPFDMKLSPDQDPLEMAGDIVNAKSMLDLLKLGKVTPKPVAEEKPPVDTSLYDPEALFGKIAPKVPEVAPEKPYEPISFRQGEEESFVSKMMDKVGRFFVSKAEESARATYALVLADEIGVAPSDVDPDLVEAFRTGFGESVTGLIRQVESDRKYPKMLGEVVPTLTTPQRLAMGAGGMAGDLPYMGLGAVAGAGGGPIAAMAGAFALPQGLRAYYSYKLDKGDIETPEQFIEVLKKSVLATLKGEVTGAATGAVGKVAAPLGGLGRTSVEAVTLTGVGAGLEGHLPTSQDFFDSAMLLVGLKGVMRAPAVASKIKDLWVKSGRAPKDIVEDIKTDPKLVTVLTGEGEIPLEVIAKAKAKVEETEKNQAELAVRLAASKKKVAPEEIVKEELKIKGEKVREAKKGKAVQLQKDTAKLKELGYDDADIGGMSAGQRALIINQEIKRTKSTTKGITKPKGKKIPRHEEVSGRIQEEGSLSPNEVDSFRKDHTTIGELPYEEQSALLGKVSPKKGKITIYRAAQGEIRPGDFVTTSYKGAKGYLKKSGEGSKIYSKRVDIGDLWAANPGGNDILWIPKGKVKEEPKPKDVIRKKAKVEEPVTELDEQTGTPRPEGLASDVHPFRDKNPKHTATMKKLYQEKINNVSATPEVFTRYLINEVNRWLNGEDVPIDKVRAGLSELSARADNLTAKFDRANDFAAWKDTVSEAAKWARNSDRLISKRTEEKVTDIGEFSREQFAKKYPSVELPTKEEVWSRGGIIVNWDPTDPKSVMKIVESPEVRRGKIKLVKPTGTTLRMGIDPTQIPEATRKLIEGARKGFEYVRKARGMKEFKPAAAAQALNEEFIRSFVDRSGNIRRELLDQLGNEGYKIVQKMYLSKGASSIAAQQLKQMQSEVYNGLDKDKKLVFDTLALSVRMLDIGKYKLPREFAYPEGFTPSESAARLELFRYKSVNGIRDFTDAEAYEIYHIKEDGNVGGKVGAYFDWMKKPLKDMLDAELISQEEYNALVSHNYRRLKLVDVYDQKSKPRIGGQKRTIYDSGVQALAHGRDTDIYESSSEVMALEVFNRAYGRILNNEANKGLLDLARTQKDNPFVAVKDSPTDRIPSGWSPFFVYKGGQRKAIYLSPEMSKEWITNSPGLSYNMSQFLRYASGSPVLRTFATGINWGFALANLPRDVMHTWFTARTFDGKEWKPIYSSNMPIFGLQMARDQGAVFSDALLRKGRYQDYIKEGGGMEFLVHQGRLLQRGRHIEGSIDKVQDFLGYFGETSEIMTRLAIRERVIRNRANEQGLTFEEASKDKKITQEATFAARDYMDFGQGGGIAKAADNAIPYLNASIQGTRGLFRSFRDNPMESTYKLAQFAALVTGLYIANQKLNPDTMKALQGNIDMQNNLVLPLGDGFSFLDEKGQTRYPYIKIPLDPGQKFFKMFFEASTDKWLGNPVDVDAVTNSLTQLSPVGVSSLPPTVGSILGYVTNKDFWLNEDIWKRSGQPYDWQVPKKFTGAEIGGSEEEYIPGQTPQAMIDLGVVTGLSPERSKQAIEQLVTRGSMWSYLVGQGYDVMFGDLPKDQKEKHLAEVLSKVPVVKRFFGITNPYSQFAAPVDEARNESSLKRWVQNRGLDARVDGYLYDKNMTRKEVIDYIISFKDKDIYDRLKDRFEFSEKIKDLPNRSFWLSLKGTPDTEARAKLYFDRLNRATPKERKQILEEVVITLPSGEKKVIEGGEIKIVEEAGGIISDEFRREVMRLRGEE